MRDLFLRAVLGGLALAGSSAWGQMHKVAKPQQVVRAVGVYEWTGDLAKPTASRLIPVSIFIEGKLEDAGVYVARPVPFALLSGNLYELQDAGVDRGLLDLAYARHLQAVDATGDMAYDDGWFGYGSVKPLAATKKPVALKRSKTLPVLNSSVSDSSSPHFGSKPTGNTTASAGTDQAKPAATGSGASSTTPSTASTPTTPASTPASTDDPDRPTMKRRPGSSGDSASSDPAAAGGTAPPASKPASPASTSGSTPTDAGAAKGTGSTSSASDDPDRPTMKRRSPDNTTDTTSTTPPTSTGSTTGTTSTPADDPDRPTMKRRSSDSTADSTTTASSGSTTGSGNNPSDDPDRPTLKRHSAEDTKRARSGANDVAGVSGGASLNDDPDRPNLHHGKPVNAMTEDDLPKLVGLPPDLHQMVAVSDAANRDPHEFTLDFDDAAERAVVLTKLQAMARAQLAAYVGAPAPAAPPVVKKTVAATRSRRAAKPAAPPPVALMDEQLKAFTLSYGGAATYVYSAHTAGTGAALRYVTVVAQADGLGELKPAIQSVTDAAHLDRTPRMRFVDVVDAEASNRASLLFELRGQTSRQFGLYRVIAAHSEQTFLTGTTQ
jgi:hypothetical protein